MTKETFFGLAINYLDNERNISIWDTWCLYRDLGMQYIAKWDINSFFHNRANTLGVIYTEDDFEELTDEMWDVLTFGKENN